MKILGFIMIYIPEFNRSNYLLDRIPVLFQVKEASFNMIIMKERMTMMIMLMMIVMKTKNKKN